MKAKDLLLLGVPLGAPMGKAFKFISAFCLAGGTKESLADEIAAIVANPASFQDDPMRSDLATSLLAPDLYLPGKPPAPWRQWGADFFANG